MRILLVVFLLGIQTLSIFAEKIMVSAQDFDQVSGPSGEDFRKESSTGLGVKSLTSERVDFVRVLDLPSGQMVKKIKAFVRVNSNSIMTVQLAYVNPKNDTVSLIATSTFTGLTSNEIEGVVLGIQDAGHVINTKKYEYVLILTFSQGGDDENLMFFGAKINVQ